MYINFSIPAQILRENFIYKSYARTITVFLELNLQKQSVAIVLNK